MDNLKYAEKRVVVDCDDWPHNEYNINVWIDRNESYELFVALMNARIMAEEMARKCPDSDIAQNRLKNINRLWDKLFSNK